MANKETEIDTDEELFAEYRNILMQFAKSDHKISAATFAGGDWFIQIRQNEQEYAIARTREDTVINARISAEEWSYSIYYQSVCDAANRLMEYIRWC